MKRFRPENVPTWLAVVIVAVIVLVEALLEVGTHSLRNDGTILTLSLAVIAVVCVALFRRRRS